MVLKSAIHSIGKEVPLPAIEILLLIVTLPEPFVVR
jgi:hypothetical protein